MTKMNRRDYLIGMGATAGLVVGAPTRELFGRDLRNNPELPRSTTNTVDNSPNQNTGEAHPIWPITNVEPSLCSSVTLIFDGLMGFFYNQITRKFEIGLHPGGDMHRPEIHIWEKPDNQCESPLNCKKVGSFSPLMQGVKLIQVQVNKTVRDVNVYHKDEPFDLERLKGDPKDFRWLPDLDGPKFYPGGLPRKKKFNIKLEVDDGTFYTRMLSNSTFWRVDANKKLSQQTGESFGRLPLIMATAIQLSGDEYVSLTLKDSKEIVLGTLNLYRKPGSVFEVDFFNRCHESHGCAEPDPYDDDDEEKRNDFHYMRKVLSVPGSKVKYTVALKEKKTGSNANFCGGSLFKVSDEAPCMGAGYGQGGGCNC